MNESQVIAYLNPLVTPDAHVAQAVGGGGGETVITLVGDAVCRGA